MRINFLFVFFSLVVGFSFLGCSSTSKIATNETVEAQNDFVASQFPNIKMNSNLRLTVLDENNPLKINTPTFLSLENLSENSIFFAPETDIHLFISNGVEYVPLNNPISYGDPSEETLMPVGKSGAVTVVMVAPEITETDRLAQILVVVVSTVKRFGMKTDEKVGTYIEIILPP